MTTQTYTKIAVSIILIGIIARLPLLDGSLWLDEAAQAIESARPLSQQFDIIADFQPPLLHLILHFVQRVSHHEAWMRLWVAFIPGIITLFATLKATQQVFNKKTALLTTFFLAISSFHVYFSQELRPYALPAMWASLSWWILLSISNSKAKRIQLGKFVLFGLVTWLGLFSSYLYPFLLIGQCVYIFFNQQKKLKPYLLTLVVTSLAYMPWIPTFLKQFSAGRAVQATLPGWSDVVSIPQLKSIPLTVGKFIYGVMLIDGSWFYALSALLIFVPTLYLSYRFLLHHKKNIFIKQIWILLAWFVVPLLTAWLISFIVPVVRPKRMLIIQPAFFLGFAYLITWGLTHAESLIKKSAAVLGVTVLVVSITSLLSYYRYPHLQRENWRELHTEILQKYPNNSVVVFSFTEPFAPWRWYDSGSYPTFSTGTYAIADADNLLDRSKYLTQYDFILVFDHLRTLTDPNDALLDIVRDFGYSQVDLIDYPNIGFVRVFAKQEATISKMQPVGNTL